MASPSRLIVGLGNPGDDYAATRHNIGFRLVDALAGQGGDRSSWQKKFKGLLFSATVDSIPVVFLKPQTFMNLSGECVGEAMRFFKLQAKDVIVFHDDIDLLPGRVKVKQGGGHAGHNGLKSLDAHIGPDYWRVRIGVGHPEFRDQVSDYVLGSFAKADKVWIDPLLDAIAGAMGLMTKGEPEAFVKALPRVLSGDTPKRAL